MRLGGRVFGVGVMGLGGVCLVWRDLILGQTLPAGLPGRVGVAWAAGVLLVVAGAGMQWRRSSAVAAVAVGMFAVVMMVVVNATVLPAHYKELGAYFGVAEPMAIAAAALVVYAMGGRGRETVRLVRVARVVLGGCAVFFGSAHFVYMGMTAPLVPKWLPPSQVFWGYATGACFVAAGLALLTGIRAKLAASLLAVMLGGFMLLVHVRVLLADHAGVFNWSELAMNVTILGVVWVVADSLGRESNLIHGL